MLYVKYISTKKENKSWGRANVFIFLADRKAERKQSPQNWASYRVQREVLELCSPLPHIPPFPRALTPPSTALPHFHKLPMWKCWSAFTLDKQNTMQTFSECIFIINTYNLHKKVMPIFLIHIIFLFEDILYTSKDILTFSNLIHSLFFSWCFSLHHWLY